MKFKYMWKDQCTADVIVDVASNKITVVNHSDDWLKRPFGENDNPTMQDLEAFFESRCFPRERANAKELLGDLELHTYDPLDIIMRTRGRQWDDFNWILFEGDGVTYEDIKLRD